MAPGNRKPFSGKQKKLLLKQTRERKQHRRPLGASSSDDSDVDHGTQSEQLIVCPAGHSVIGGDQLGETALESSSCTAINASSGESLLEQFKVLQLHAQPNNAKSEATRFALKFFRDSDEALRKARVEASKPFVRLQPQQLEVSDDQLQRQLDRPVDFPKRPPWHSGLSREQLLANEEKYFRQYLEQLEAAEGPLQELGYFELNLETWRQLWRTLEMSDVILLIADIRFCAFHFPAALLHYVRETLHKDLILVLNKCDLVDAELVLAWTEYWKQRLPGVHVVPFASYAGMKTKDTGRHKGRRYGKFCMASESVRRLYEACEHIVKGRIDLSDWQTKIESDLRKVKMQMPSAELNSNATVSNDKIDRQGKDSNHDDLAENDNSPDDDDFDWNCSSVTAGWTDKRRAGYQKARGRLNRKAKAASDRRSRKANTKTGKQQSSLSSSSSSSSSSEPDWSDDDCSDEEKEENADDSNQDAGRSGKKSKAKKKNRNDDEHSKCGRSGDQNVAVIDDHEFDYHEFKALDQGVLTIGCVGHPNVGKSSVLNAIMGDVVVSVSRTPGHTKHFQTIFVTQNVRLCDCPGLVFPSRAPRPLQVLMGCFPIAQLREPYSAVQFVAERSELERVLRVRKPFDETGEPWSAMEMCERWAEKRGYFTAKGARPDVYRAANQILRMALDGRTICITFYPPNYTNELDTKWRKHAELADVRFLQRQLAPLERERTFKTERKLTSIR